MPQVNVPCEKGPYPFFRERKRKAVRNRENAQRRVTAKGVWNALLRHLLNPQPKCHQPLSPLALHFAVVRNIGDRKFIRMRKHHLQEAAALQIDQHGGVGTRIIQPNRCWCLHAPVELVDRDIQQFRRFRLRDRSLGKRPVAQAVETFRLFLASEDDAAHNWERS